MIYAKIENNVVTQTQPSKEDGFTSVPSGTICGMVLDGDNFTEPEIIDLRTYTEKRKEEYPPIGDQLDEIMKWLATESEFNIPAKLKSIAGKCMAVKSKYPKTQE